MTSQYPDRQLSTSRPVRQGPLGVSDGVEEVTVRY
jgi:hypothetical protein